MDDTSLNEIISELPEKCIALMEDIDAAFLSSVTRENESQEKSPVDKKNGEAGGQQGKGPSESNSRITLSGLLNALDGVGAQEGRLLFATTNKYSALDPALCRPGRMDLHIEFKLASKYQADELFKCFYLPSDDFSSTPSDAVDDEKAETESVDSGYAEKLSEPPSTTLSAMDAPACLGSTHSARVPVLTRGQVTHLAKKFADAIPEREFSMASLQGYLMGYKTRPFDAVKEASSWVEKERSEQIRKQKADSSSPALPSANKSEKEGIPDTKDVTPAP
jgi:chaperone BCS1